MVRVRLTSILLAMSLGAIVVIQAATKTLVPVFEPVTPAADPTKALVVSGYCNPITIRNLTTDTLFTSIPAIGTGCAELALLISPGLPGFPAGTAYVAYPDAAGTGTIVAVVPAGGAAAPTPLATTPGAFDHVNLIFDTQGLYGGGLLVITEAGPVFGLNTGLGPSAATLRGVITIPGGTSHFESPAFAPAGFGSKGGLLWVVNELEDGIGDNTIYAITPGSFVPQSVIAVPVSISGGDRVESLAFVTPDTCTTPIPGGPGSSNLVDALFGIGAVAFYSAPATFAYVGIEFTGNLFQLVPSGAAYSFVTPAYDTGLEQQEHLFTPVCLAASACTLTQGGYKNHFNDRVVGLTLGGTFYSASDVDSILQNNAVKGNGLISLAHQLITAMLNQFYGATPTPAQLAAILSANNLIASIQAPGTKVIPPLDGGFLAPADVGTLVSTLTAFNESNHCR